MSKAFPERKIKRKTLGLLLLAYIVAISLEFVNNSVLRVLLMTMGLVVLTGMYGLWFQLIFSTLPVEKRQRAMQKAKKIWAVTIVLFGATSFVADRFPEPRGTIAQSLTFLLMAFGFFSLFKLFHHAGRSFMSTEEAQRLFPYGVLNISLAMCYLLIFMPYIEGHVDKVLLAQRRDEG